MVRKTDRNCYLIAALLLLVIAGFLWGYFESRQASRYAVRLENGYQRAFHELVWHLEALEGELAKLKAAGTAAQSTEKLATVWRQLFAAQEKVGQLPLGLIPLEHTESYLASAGREIFNLLLKNGSLNTNERALLSELQEGAGKLAGELSAMQAMVLMDNLRWLDAEHSLRKQGNRHAAQDNSVLTGFTTLNEKVEAYPEIKLDERIGVALPPPRLSGPRVTKEAAAAYALWFLEPGNESAYRVLNAELTGGDLPAYSFIIGDDRNPLRRVTMAVTETLGRVLWMLDNASIGGDGPLPLASLESMAAAFLHYRGYADMHLVGTHEYQDSAFFAYVFRQQDVLVYPDLLRVQVSKNDGRVIGFEGNGYTVWHRKRTLPEPVFKQEQALEVLAPDLELIGAVQLAIVFNAEQQETLAYELPVRQGEDSFLVYIDARSGSEVQIVRLEGAGLPVSS